MSAGEVLLTVKDVHLRLGNLQVLEGLDFTVVDRVREGVTTGQVVSLLGPSGVGKTRLLRIIAGLDTPDRGTVVGPSGAMEAGTVGLVFQHYPLLRHRTVFENLTLAGTVNGMSAADSGERAQELLRRFGLGDKGVLYPAQLSGGQRQRVAIAQQLVRHKNLLLMDEPFSGLDPATLDDVIQLVSEVANMHEQNTILLVTHDISAAMRVSDTLLMLGRDRNQEGKVVSGAKVQATYDLVERGLAWQPDVEQNPAFLPLEREIRARFKRL